MKYYEVYAAIPGEEMKFFKDYLKKDRAESDLNCLARIGLDVKIYKKEI